MSKLKRNETLDEIETLILKNLIRCLEIKQAHFSPVHEWINAYLKIRESRRKDNDE